MGVDHSILRVLAAVFFVVVIPIESGNTLLTSSKDNFTCGRGDVCRLNESIRNEFLDMFQESAEICYELINGSYGSEFEDCVDKRIDFSAFPDDVDMREHMLRNFTCSKEDASSHKAIGTVELEYAPTENEYYMNSAGIYVTLPNRITSEAIGPPFRVEYSIKLKEAKAICKMYEECYSFTIYRTNRLTTSFLGEEGKKIVMAGTALFFTLEPFLYVRG